MTGQIDPLTMIFHRNLFERIKQEGSNPLLSFNSVSSQLPHFEFLNILRHYSVTFFANWVGGGVLMGLAYAWLNNIKSLYND